MADVSFMDSSGINTLVWACRRRGRDDHAVVVRNPSDSVRRVLALSGLTGLFTIEPAPHDAREPDGTTSRPRSPDREIAA